jgi:hypothetical protein
LSFVPTVMNSGFGLDTSAETLPICYIAFGPDRPLFIDVLPTSDVCYGRMAGSLVTPPACGDLMWAVDSGGTARIPAFLYTN